MAVPGDLLKAHSSLDHLQKASVNYRYGIPHRNDIFSFWQLRVAGRENRVRCRHLQREVVIVQKVFGGTALCDTDGGIVRGEDRRTPAASAIPRV